MWKTYKIEKQKEQKLHINEAARDNHYYYFDV